MDVSRRWKSVGTFSGEITGVLGLLAGVFLSFDTTRAVGVAVSLVAVVFFAITVYVGVRKGKRIRRVADESHSSLTEAVDVREVLRSIAANMGLGHAWRITLYEVRESAWHRLCRRASRPEFQDGGGRVMFDLDTGCIGAALRSGVPTEMPSLPDPRHDFDGWVGGQTAWRVATLEAEKLRMKSRSYVAVVHEIPFGPYEGVHVGVVVESERELGTSRASVERVFTLELVALLHKLVKAAPIAAELRSVAVDSRRV